MPKFEVKKFKKQMGHEGPGYHCQLFMDGRHIAECFDEGNGGPVLVQYDTAEARQTVYAHIKSLPPYHWEKDQYTEAHDSPMDEELFMMVLVEDFQNRKDCQKKTLFKLGGKKPGLYQINKPYSPEIAKFLRDKYGADLVEIVNETLVRE
jgi:hypothetical protein